MLEELLNHDLVGLVCVLQGGGVCHVKEGIFLISKCYVNQWMLPTALYALRCLSQQSKYLLLCNYETIDVSHIQCTEVLKAWGNKIKPRIIVWRVVIRLLICNMISVWSKCPAKHIQRKG